MTTSPEIRDCENEAALIRRNISDIQDRQDELRRRIQGLRRATAEIEDRRLVPEFRLRIGELEGLIRATEDELKATMPELESFRQQLHAKEQKCWELRRQQTRSVPSEDELRKTIIDPRYRRDGDPVLSRTVSEGFQRLYPDESDD